MNGYFNITYDFFDNPQWDVIAKIAKIKPGLVISFVDGIFKKGYSNLNRGSFEYYDIASIAFRIGVTLKKAKIITEELVKIDFIKITNNTCEIVNKEKYQKEIKNYQNFNTQKQNNINETQEERNKRKKREWAKENRKSRKVETNVEIVENEIEICVEKNRNKISTKEGTIGEKKETRKEKEEKEILEKNNKKENSQNDFSEKQNCNELLQEIKNLPNYEEMRENMKEFENTDSVDLVKAFRSGGRLAVEKLVVDKSQTIEVIVEKSFKPPTISEISDYCLERNNGINPEAFFDFYQSKGWLIGKNLMKDWQASVRTWERNNNQKQLNSNKNANQNNTSERNFKLFKASGYSIKEDGSIRHFADDDRDFYDRQEEFRKIREAKQAARKLAQQEQQERKISNG